MKRFVLLVVLAVALGAGYLWWQARQRNAPPPMVDEAPLAPNAPSEPPASSEPRYPIPAPAAPPVAEQSRAPEQSTPVPMEPDAAPPSAPLPPLNDSNALMTEVFSDLFGAEMLRELFVPDELIRRFVVTIDNLPNKKLPPRQHLLVKPVAGSFAVTGTGGEQVIAADNAARYAPYVQLAARVDAQQLVDAYVRFYPLFQAAYAELGEPNAYFNDRLIEVIDHLLDAPQVVEPIHVVQPKVFYEYAAPGLEALSAGHKIMLRMGRANAERIKTKLREIRQALTHEAPPQGDEKGGEDMGQAPEGDWKIVP